MGVKLDLGRVFASPLTSSSRLILAIMTVAGTFAINAAPALALSATTTTASPITFTAATLNGTVNPEGVQLTECFFEYTTYKAPCVPASESIPADSTVHPVSAEITDLTPGQQYSFRLVTSNGSQTVEASAQVFTARPAHVFSTSIAGSGANALSEPTAVAVDDSGGASNGDLYVADPANHRVEKFDSAGNFILMIGREVNKSAVESAGSEAEENLCTAASGDSCQAGTPGTAAGSFATPDFLAVDDSASPSAGDLYVGDRGTNTKDGYAQADVQKYGPQGNLLTSWGQGGSVEGAGGVHFTNEGGAEAPGDGLHGVAVDTAGDLFAFGRLHYFEFPSNGSPGQAFVSPLDEGFSAASGEGLALDPEGNFYSVGGAGSIHALKKASPQGALIAFVAPGSVALALDPLSRDLFTFEAGGVWHFSGYCASAPNCTTPADTFGVGELNEPQGLAVDSSTGVVYVADTGNHRVAVFDAVPYLPDASASATPLTPTSERLVGTADPAGAPAITACRFEYGKEAGDYALGSLACNPGAPLAAKTNVAVEADLNYGTTYHYRLLLENENGANSSYDQTFTTLPAPPQVGAESVSAVHADTALVHAQIVPGGGEATFHTSYHVEYLTAEQFERNVEAGKDPFTGASQSPGLDAGSARSAQNLTVALSGLTAGTTYRYRVFAENATEATTGAVHAFTTFPFANLNDPCPNAHVRQQTSAAGLLDCRAYELVSAADTAGYDVESNLIAGQTPYAGYPDAEGRVLYGIHNGGIPGTNHPTNRGVDPYLAIRGNTGWSTEYVGIPANATPSEGPFSSTLLEADSGLNTFAFGGPGICSPCFADGSTGEPLHLPSGELVQGMAGSTPQAKAKPEGFIGRDLSANGEHFVFGSKSQFEPEGNHNGTDLSIYDRNLKTDETKVVSKTPSGATMTGPGIGELDISSDGSHILIGQLVSEVGSAKYWHLYMNAGDSSKTTELTPGAKDGVLFDGMTADGSKVFFSSEEHLTGEDTEHSGPDIYMWSQQGEEGGHPLSLISKGNSASCDPAANSAHVHWNTVGSEANCGVVAIGGGGGVSSGNGTIYFLSPEKLAGSEHGTENAPNLYVAGPEDGYAPHYVSTLESVLTGPQPLKLKHVFKEDFGSFTKASALAVEHSSGDLYVLDAGANTVEKFDSEGNPVNFTAGAGIGTNKLSGAETPAGSFSELSTLGLPVSLAVDQTNGDLYVPDTGNGVIDVFDSSGKFLPAKQIKGLSLPAGVAIDPTDGHVYVSTFFAGKVAVFDASGNPLSSFSTIADPASIAVDSAGTVYVSNGSPIHPSGEVAAYEGSTGNNLGQIDTNHSFGVAVDASDNDLYVNEGEQIAQYDSSGDRLAATGLADLSGSSAIAIDPEGNLYATNNGGVEVALFAASLAPDPRVDNPAVLDSVSEPETRHTADFQLTPDGQFAAFPSTLALAGGEEETAGHTVLYRYDAGAEKLDCISCTSSGAPSAGNSSLATDGLSLTDQGQVFFTTADQLSVADTDNREDVYEWEAPGAGNCTTESPSFAKAAGDCIALISAGTSPFDSGLLSVDARGTDAYFFTRDSLAPQDQNGPTMKIYDAREGGGFPYSFPPVLCRASDECHGASSPAPSPLEVRTLAGTPSNPAEPKRCKSGLVRWHGRCVHRHLGKHRHHRATKHHRRGGK